MIRKNREPCILFLEDSFAESHAQRLREAGFNQVERFRTHFKDQNVVEQSVKDPRIIRFCNQKGWLLVTTDSNMERTHCEVIKSTSVAILATAHNHAPDMNEWVEGLIAAKAAIERHHKKTERPWCATFTRQGHVNVHIVAPAVKSRRNRPRES